MPTHFTFVAIVTLDNSVLENKAVFSGWVIGICMNVEKVKSLAV